jgi:hypothetical protein
MTDDHLASGRGLTVAQRRLLRYLLAFLAERGRMPRVREVMRRFAFRSCNAVYCHYEALRRRGLLSWSPRLAGGARLAGVRLAMTFEDSEQGRLMRQLFEGGGEGRDATGCGPPLVTARGHPGGLPPHRHYAGGKVIKSTK